MDSILQLGAVAAALAPWEGVRVLWGRDNVDEGVDMVV